MKVTLNKIDSVNATLTIEVVKDDYEQKVKQKLNELKRTTDFPGFRKGMVPQSLIEKKFGKAVLIEEVEKILTKQLDTCVKENQLPLIKEPLPRADEQKNLDFNTAGDYQFTFDLGFIPPIDVQLTKDDILPYYTVAVTDDMINKQIKLFKDSFNTYEQVELVEENDIVKGILTELNGEGIHLENGIFIEDASLIPSYIKEVEEKNKFLDAKLNDIIIFNPFKAYEGNEAELSSLLNIKKEELNSHTGNFSYTITRISRYKVAELNQELFDKICEPGTVTTEEQFRDKIKELIFAQSASQRDYLFLTTAMKFLEEKNKDIQLPDEFLKRYLLVSNEAHTPESAEKEYLEILPDLKYQLIQNKLVEENNINVTKEDIYYQAEINTRALFAYYGVPNVTDQLVENYILDTLKKKESVQKFYSKVLDNKLVSALKEAVTIETKEVTEEEFQKLY
jgi:trigger factor